MKYTHCCAEPVCVECQSDLVSLTNSNLTCLGCQDSIKVNSLVDRVLNQLDLIIKPYQVAITALQSHLSSHYDNLVEIKRVLVNISNDVIVQEYHRFSKPLQTTMQDNTAVLSHLEQLQKQITRLVNDPVIDHVTHDGRLIQLSRQVIRTIWSQPNYSLNLGTRLPVLLQLLS